MASSSDRWQRLEGLFYEAVELDPAARKAFLDERCAEDAELRKEVESLLKSADVSSSDRPLDFLQKPIQDAARNVVATPPPLALKPGVRFGRYEVLTTVGAGGMGEVYLAHDTQLQRKVALKLLARELTRDERGLRRFEQEARAASALNHPNILTVYEFGQIEGTYYIASEYVEGETLRERIKKAKLSVGEVTGLAIQMASALAAAHARGIVHRDIKPDNIIVRNDGLVKVLDFGIAKLSAGLGAFTGTGGLLSTVLSTSRPGAVFGTIRYMSPEQARGQDVDGRSDLFSLSLVMYEMVTGHAAFQGDTASDVIAEILKGEPTPLAAAVPDLPPEFEAIVLRAMRKNPEERYPSAREMLAELKEFRDENEFQEKLKKSSGRRELTPRPGSMAPGGLAPAKPVLGDAGASAASRKRLPRIVAATLGVLALAALIVLPSLRKRWATPPPTNTPRTLAVLPFRNLRPDPQTDFLGFSLADAIITKLGYLSALTVRPSSSVDSFRNKDVNPQKAAAQLQVETLLTGTYLRDGDVLRVTTQLIDVKPNKILWQDTIDLKYDRLLTLQDTVSQQILKGLEVKLSPAEQEKLRPHGPVNPVAYEDYLRGVNLYSLDNFPAAISALERATLIDPSYALAWAHLGRAYTTNASLQFGGSEQYSKAQAAYEKALALDPGLIEARVYLANLLTDTGRVEQAVPMMRAVLAQNPGYAEALWELGYAYRFGGMLQESVEESEKARQDNPSVKINSSAMNAYLYLGEYDKFMQSLPSNDSVYVLFYRGFGEYHLAHSAQAARYFDRAYEKDPKLLPARVGKALSYAIHGDAHKGVALLHSTESQIVESGAGDAESLYKVAEAYAVLNDKSSALLMFHRTIEGGFFPYPYFERDPLLNSLRTEPEFEMLMKQARARHEQFKAQFFGSGS
jgi:serine/threonine protein kinase/tetratricopeptide (TPR) repeat protein